MGIIRTAARLIPYATVFLLGYYAGTIESGKHDRVFCEKPRVQEEYAPDETLEARLDSLLEDERLFTLREEDKLLEEGEVMVYAREARQDAYP